MTMSSEISNSPAVPELTLSCFCQLAKMFWLKVILSIFLSRCNSFALTYILEDVQVAKES